MDGDHGTDALDARLRAFDAELAELRARVAELQTASALVPKAQGQEDKLSLIVFSGTLDRLIAAFVLATGAAAMGMQVSMFFTFWATAGLRMSLCAPEKPPPMLITWLDSTL